MSQRDMNSCSAELSHPFLCLVVKLDRRRSAWLAYDFNVLPTNAFRPTSSERFHHRFFRRKARGIACELRCERFAITDFAFREYSRAKSLAASREYFFQTRYFNEIDS